MQVSSVDGAAFQPASNSDGLTKMRQLLQELGSALESGNLPTAKSTLAQLQAAAPTAAGTNDDSIVAKMEALGRAVNSGDVRAARDAYADAKKALAQRPAAGVRRGGGARGAAPGGAPAGEAKKSGGARAGSSSAKVYDVRDTNQDGTVSPEEELAYELEHPEVAEQGASPAGTDNSGGAIDTSA